MDKTVIELKAEVYDRIGLIEQYQTAIRTVQEEIAKINQEIAKKVKEEIPATE